MDRQTRNHLALSFLSLMLALGGSSWAVDKAGAQAVDTNKPTAAEIETWRQKILHTPQPTKGCFTASYPETAWREVPCSTKPTRIRLPKRGVGARTATIGDSNGDFAAQVTGHISEVEGDIENISGLTSETSMMFGAANSYGLQLNTDYFMTSACSASPYLGTAYVGTLDYAICRGWEQFIFNSSGGTGIQYWLANYGPAGTTCPAPHHVGCTGDYVYPDGWCEFQFTPASPVNCVANGVNIDALPSTVTRPLDITMVDQVKLTARVAGASGSADDTAIVTYTPPTGTPSAYAAYGLSFIPDLSTQWQRAEFNLFGGCCGDQAVLNTGTTMDVRIAVTSGTADPPDCDFDSFTGETNNMTLVELMGPVMHTGTPSLVFRQSNVPGSVAATCAGAITIGDTHITTFDGVYYDFQAYGDFLLAQDGPDFVVQARQASGAPLWPNAAVNKAIATRMGGTRIALYIEPTRLDVDGAATALADGDTILRPTGVQVSRTGNVYSISDEHGNRVRATLNSTWIDVAVGLGLAPHSAVRGLLGNPRGNGRELVTADRVVLKAPVLFHDLYSVYAESWRVLPKESLFTGETKSGIPTKPFYASDLTREKSARALAACKAAGVKNAALLDSCVLDTTVLGDRAAVKAFVGLGAPRYVVKPVASRGKQAGD
ncbi:MAG: VWD domain-containing protein [Usitatibacter sp.]